MTKNKIENYLVRLGAKRTLSGFKCLVETIYMYSLNPNLRLYEDIYRTVANMFGYRLQNVERNMRTVIENLYDNPKSSVYDLLDCDISTKTACPTLKSFIDIVIHNINKEI